MLPNLSRLNKDYELDLGALSLDTGVKRTACGLWNARRLKIRSLPSAYRQLLEDIATRIRRRATNVESNPGLADSWLELVALKELDVLLQRPLGGVFVPQYESQHASISPIGIPPSLAERIAVAFFEARSAAPPKKLDNFDQPIFNRLTRKASKQGPEMSDRTRAEIAALLDNSKEVCTKFVKDHRDLANELARNAIRAFLELPSSASQPLVRAQVTLRLQEVCTFTQTGQFCTRCTKTAHALCEQVTQSPYVAINDDIHMDAERDMLHDGVRYGRPASEQDVQSMVASFCADALGPTRVTLTGCGTAYYDGLPTVDPALLREAAERIRLTGSTMDTFTPYEILSQLGILLSSASTDALGKQSAEELQTMGITSESTNALEWSNVNAVTFHSSPSHEQVLANPTLRNGRVVPRMRAFAILEVDTESDERCPEESRCWRLDDVTDARDRPIEVMVKVDVLDGSGRGGKGEELMP